MSNPPIEFDPQIGDTLFFKEGQLQGRWHVDGYDLPDDGEVDGNTIVLLSSSSGEMTALLGEIRKGILGDLIEVTLNRDL